MVDLKDAQRFEKDLQEKGWGSRNGTLLWTTEVFVYRLYKSALLGQDRGIEPDLVQQVRTMVKRFTQEGEIKQYHRLFLFELGKGEFQEDALFAEKDIEDFYRRKGLGEDLGEMRTAVFLDLYDADEWRECYKKIVNDAQTEVDQLPDTSTANQSPASNQGKSEKRIQRDAEWQQRVDEEWQKNKMQSHSSVCMKLCKELGTSHGNLLRRTKNPRK